MIVLSYADDNLILTNENKSIIFNIRDKKLTDVIKKNLDKFGGSATISFGVKNSSIIVLDSIIRIKIPERVAFEISSRLDSIKLANKQGKEI